MDNIILEHPLGKLFSGSLSSNYREGKDDTLEFRLSNICPFYTFNDYEREDDNDDFVLSETIKYLKKIKELNLDVLLNDGYGNFEHNVNKLLKSLYLGDESARRKLHNTTINLKVSDNNKQVVDELIQALFLKYEDLDYTINIRQEHGVLIYSSIEMPYIFSLSDDFMDKDYKYVTNAVKNSINDIQEELKEHGLVVRYNVPCIHRNRLKFSVSFFYKKNGLFKFNDDKKALLDQMLERHIKSKFKIRQLKLDLLTFEGELCFNGYSFDICRGSNKEAYNGSVH